MEGGGGGVPAGGNGTTETDASQEVQGEDLQRGTHTVRSPRGQSVEREAQRERANAGALASIQTSSPPAPPFSSLPSNFFLVYGRGIIYYFYDWVFRGWRLHTDAGVVQMCAKKLLLPRMNINIIHE